MKYLCIFTEIVLKFAFEHLQELESDGGLPLLLKEQSDQ
jgi:hypothetical protein